MVTETSMECYVTSQEVFKKQEDKVLHFILNNPNCCDLDASKYLNLSINAVTGRRNKLMKDGFIYNYSSKISKISFKRVNTWAITREGIIRLFP